MTKYDFFDFNECYEQEELAFKLESEDLEMDVLRYKEETDDTNYNKIAKDRMTSICNYCIDKIIELHNGKDIIINEDNVFLNARYANYYSDVIELAYDIDIKSIVNFINNYYIDKVRNDGYAKKRKLQ